jgi:hypothetical protein
MEEIILDNIEHVTSDTEQSKPLKKKLHVYEPKPSVIHSGRYIVDSSMIMFCIGYSGMYSATQFVNKTPTQLQKLDKSLASSYLHFDKNFNPLTVYIADNEHFRRSTTHRSSEDYTKTYPRVSQHSVGLLTNLGIAPSPWERISKYFVIDKKSFFESKFTKFRLKFVNNCSYPEILTILADVKNLSVKIVRFMNLQREILGSKFDADDFDIFYHVGLRRQHPEIRFCPTMKYKDIIIKNSIEEERIIHELVVQLKGTFHSSSETFIIDPVLKGKRTKFSPLDLVWGYEHSHLRRTLFTMNTFCTGGSGGIFSHYLNILNGDAISPLDYEFFLYSLDEFVQWESLEGGPHCKIEQIGVKGMVISRYRNIISNNRYTNRRRRAILKALGTEKVRKLASTFKLVNNGYKGSTFKVDFNEFVKIFNDLLDESVTESIPAVVFYDKEKNEFYDIAREYSSTEDLYREARELQRTHHPIYINGKISRIKLETKGQETIEQLHRGVRTLNPHFISDLAQTILHYLNEELKKQ